MFWHRGLCFWKDTEMANFNIPYKTEREGQILFYKLNRLL